MQKITELNIKPVKKQAAVNKNSLKLIKDFGPEGDAYGAPGERQITLLGEEDRNILDNDMEKGLCIHRFAPNLTISGSTAELIKGGKYKVGDIEIEISHITKACHKECEIIKEKRICLLPKTARFGSVLNTGLVKIGDEVTEIK